jgi:hypothetical protein
VDLLYAANAGAGSEIQDNKKAAPQDKPLPDPKQNENAHLQ